MKILVNKEDLKYLQESLESGEVLKEDLNRWFKEKWVDVSKKVNGKHPPCGRKKAADGSYPKCRPSKKVSKETPKTANSYTKKEKKGMTNQKRNAEKTHPKSGTGNAPKLTHYNEEIISDITNLILKEIHSLNEFDENNDIIYEDEFGSVQRTNFIPDDLLNEAEYQGRKVQLGKPFLTPNGPKKRSVYVKNSKGNVVKVNFGDPNMRIKKHIPSHRKSFRARHHCDNPGPRWKPNFWSCWVWR